MTDESPSTRLETAIQEDPDETASEVVPSREFMCVRLGEVHFALPISSVLEVVNPEAPTPIPRLPDWIPGVVRRGRGIVAVLDLAVLCEAESERAPTRMLVLAAGELVAAVPVSRVTGIQSIPELALSTRLGDHGALGRFASAQFEHDYRIYPVIDVERLLRHASPADGASETNR